MIISRAKIILSLYLCEISSLHKVILFPIIASYGIVYKRAFAPNVFLFLLYKKIITISFPPIFLCAMCVIFILIPYSDSVLAAVPDCAQRLLLYIVSCGKLIVVPLGALWKLNVNRVQWDPRPVFYC